MAETLFLNPGGCCGCNTPNCGSCCVTCSPCNIPKADLTCTVTPGPTVRTLRWQPGLSNWFDGAFTLSCSGGSIALSGGGPWTRGASTCNPFSVTFTQGGSTAVVTAPAYGATTCCQYITIKNQCTVTVGGAVVSIYDTAGGTLLAQATTPTGFNRGVVSLIWIGSGTVYIEVSHPSGRFDTYTSSTTLTCGSAIEITLAAATGYHCTADCNCYLPFKDTLNFTDSVTGSTTLTYDTVSSRWRGTISTSFSGCGCPARTVTPSYSFPAALGGCSVDVGLPPDGSACPNTGVAWGGIAVVMTPFVCPETGSLSGSGTVTGACGNPTAIGKYYGAKGTATFTITE